MRYTSLLLELNSVTFSPLMALNVFGYLVTDDGWNYQHQTLPSVKLITPLTGQESVSCRIVEVCT